MPSTATTRNRLEKQGTGENTNTWGSKLNATALDLIDAALDGRTSFTLSGAKTLSSTNFVADEARMRFLDITGGNGGTVLLPAVEKWYIVRNKTSGNVVFSNGGTSNATVAANQVQIVVTDGSNVYTDTAVTSALASAAAAAASAASINDANLVHAAGAETISGLKTFSSGIVINSQALSGLTSTGKSIAEAANPAAVRAILGTGIGAVGLTTSQTYTTTVPTFSGQPNVSLVPGTTNTIAIRGQYSTSGASTGLGVYLTSAGAATWSGHARIWHANTAGAYTELPISIQNQPLGGSFSGANAVQGAKYIYEVQMTATNVQSLTSIILGFFNTSGSGTVTVYPDGSVVTEPHG